VARTNKKEQASETGSFDEQADASSGERVRLTPVEIQQKVFRLAFRGYNERDVDEFLDHVTEDLAALHEENKRLRERVAEGGSVGGDTGAADKQAEAIVRQAREHAVRLVEDAERRAAITEAAGSAAGSLPTAFLLQERQFLQQMASLIQGHAQRLKDEARRARADAEEAEPATGQEPGEQPSRGAPEPSDLPGAAAAAAGGAGAVGASEVFDDEAHDPSEPPAQSEPPVQSEPPAQSEPPVQSEPPAPNEPDELEAPSPPEPPTADEVTSPWSPVGEAAPQTDEGSADDPLASAWESAFSGDAGETALGDERPRREEEGEPSLRELFWGEE
jgi:DivIVA domain-containing protein